MSSTFTRAAAGEGETVGEAALAGSAVAPGPGEGDAGCQAPLPVVDGANTTATSSRATFVA
jgi:hypothetical protein